MRMHKADNGVTLVEMLTVIGIIALLLVLVLPGIKGLDNQSQARRVRNLLTVLDTALEQYYEQRDGFPDVNVPGLIPDSLKDPVQRRAYQMQYLVQALLDEPASAVVMEKINAHLLMNKERFANNIGLDIGPEIYDPWGNLIRYEYSPGMGFPRVTSTGPDGVFNTADDIKNRP